MMELIVYVVYLILQVLFACLQRIYWLLSGLSEPPEDAPIRLMSILYRRQLSPLEIFRWEDFVAVHKSFARISTLDNNHWTLYALDKKYAYFIEMPNRIVDYHVQKYPFLCLPLFADGKQLAVVPMTTFLSWADQLAERAQPKTVFYTNSARSGSTLFAQMLNHPGTSVCFAEPIPITTLAIGYSEKYWHESEIETLLKAVVTVLRKDVPTDQVCIFKTRGADGCLVPILAKVFPEIKNVFLFRKNGLNSVERMIISYGEIPQTLIKLYLICPALSKTLSWTWIGSFGRFFRIIALRNMKERAAILYAAPYANYLKNKHLYCLPVIWYDEIMTDPVNTLPSIFHELDIPQHKIKDALLCLENDSQKDTFLSQSNLKGVKATEMTDAIRTRLHEIAEVLDVPKDTF